MEDRRDKLRPWYLIVPWVMLSVVLFMVFTTSSHGETNEKLIKTKDTTPEVVEVPPLPPEITEVTQAADVAMTALRIDPPDTTAPPDPCGPEMREYVNNLPYRFADPVPTIEAYHIVATCNGWTANTQAIYEKGIIYDIFPGESNYCPFRRGGDWVGPNCEVTKIGHGEDTGFFQITAAGWGKGATLCVNGWYCSPQDILFDEWASMDAGIKLIQHGTAWPGFPWTWDKYEPPAIEWACTFHPIVCWEWPSKWVNVP